MRDREELTPLLVDEPMGGAVEGDEEAPTHAAPPPRILLVDDDEDDYIVTQELLRDTYGSAFKLDWCSTWEDALQAFSADGYDVFLLDQNLGAREGTDLVRTAVASGCNVPIILLTGNADRQLDLEAMRAGAADFLVKGQTSAVLMERSIRYALSQHGGHRRCKRQISWEAPSILLVDDDEDDYILARAMLFEIYGRHCKVDWRSKWEEALRSITEQAHDVYLIDYRLGERTGIELVREAIALGCQGPIILLTGDASREVDLEAMRAGASDYLVKSELTVPLLDRALRYALERYRGELRLAELAKYDQLTGLANRFLFREFLSKTLARAERYHRSVALVFLDLDRFKLINDTLGHQVGDELLRAVSERLRNAVRASDIVARLGGDEFAMVLDEITDPAMVGHFCERILAAFRRPFQIGSDEIRSSTSVGVAIYPMDADNIDDLLKSADTAMYHAKEEGANNFQFYTMDMHLKASRLLTIERDLHHALERREFMLWYQPQIAADSGRVVGLEALLRWQSPGKGIIKPGDFIHVAEETGLIVTIGRWVMQEACEQAKRWIDAGFSDFHVCVNVAARQFRDGTFFDSIKGILQDTNVPPHYLEIELTESSLLKSPDAVQAVLRRLLDIGVRVALDDFGTGYSSLNHLRSFPGTAIKIDQSFVANIETSHDDSQIVKALIQMAHGLGFVIVAEGVETPGQLRALAAQQCDLFQGYLLSFPVPAEEITMEMLAKDHLAPFLAGPGESDGAAGGDCQATAQPAAAPALTEPSPVSRTLTLAPSQQCDGKHAYPG